MNKDKAVAVVLVVGLGVGLHLAFRGLAGQLPQMFPQIAGETPEETLPPVAMINLGGNEELSPPPAAIAVKKSEVEELQTPEPQRPKRLVTTTPIPLLPPPGQPGETPESFEVTPDLEPIVDFWKKIYAHYDTHQVVFHDMEHLEIQYGVLDFTSIDEKEISAGEKSAIRQQAIGREMERIRQRLDELREWKAGQPLSKEAKRIARLFQNIDEPDKFKTASENVRSQVGLRNRFLEGVRNSGKYMPLFEEIFQNYGVPVEISRLAFVESLFKERALSKVGAAGLWQFMPDTARRYMTIERLVDERYDPIIATHGAARLLLKNYELLGTWPLAINAYNSGPANLLKAVSRLGTRDIATIITRYRTGSYAFASRNFYPQFLAALDAYENQERYFGRVEKEPVMRFDLVQLPTTMELPEIAYLADIPMTDLKELNPAFAPTVFRGGYSLPAGSEIRIPEGGHEKFSVRFVDFFSGAREPQFHVVETGETLREIASRYEISPADLQRANHQRGGRLEVGRVLLIPGEESLVQNRLSF